MNYIENDDTVGHVFEASFPPCNLRGIKKSPLEKDRNPETRTNRTSISCLTHLTIDGRKGASFPCGCFSYVYSHYKSASKNALSDSFARLDSHGKIALVSLQKLFSREKIAIVSLQERFSPEKIALVSLQELFSREKIALASLRELFSPGKIAYASLQEHTSHGKTAHGSSPVDVFPGISPRSKHQINIEGR